MRNELKLLVPAGKTNHILFWGLALCLLLSGCGDNRYTQCEQIFQIAQRAGQKGNSGSYFSNQQPTEIKSWLEAARMMEETADRLAALHIDDSELIEYQNKFVTIYRIYSQATYDAVKARENKNFSALKSAKDDAIKAGQMQRDLIKQINAYCLDI